MSPFAKRLAAIQRATADMRRGMERVAQLARTNEDPVDVAAALRLSAPVPAAPINITIFIDHASQERTRH